MSSRSPRSVWVEIPIKILPTVSCTRHAPHGACELKFFLTVFFVYSLYVTLPTERVSWNFFSSGGIIPPDVTLPTERVSWNRPIYYLNHLYFLSRSPRSVWVEILLFCDVFNHSMSRSPRSVWVEIRRCWRNKKMTVASRSPRSVWVEIWWNAGDNGHFKEVTLPTERVSWNTFSFSLGRY